MNGDYDDSFSLRMAVDAMTAAGSDMHPSFFLEEFDEVSILHLRSG
jgi:hypothetical protein